MWRPAWPFRLWEVRESSRCRSNRKGDDASDSDQSSHPLGHGRYDRSTSFTPSNPIPPNHFSHQLWQEWLRANVYAGVVDYPAIQRQEQLTAYLALLDRVDPNQFSEDDRLALLINAYNAFGKGHPGPLFTGDVVRLVPILHRA